MAFLTIKVDNKTTDTKFEYFYHYYDKQKQFFFVKLKIIWVFSFFNIYKYFRDILLHCT